MTSAKSIVPLCRHTKTNGRRCKSPALNGGRFCYFHQRLRRAHRPATVEEAMTSYWQEYPLQGPEEEEFGNIKRSYPRQDQIRFPPLEDAESVQLATSMLFQAIATGQIHFKRARLLIYTLKIACINQRALRLDRAEDAAVDAQLAPDGTDATVSESTSQAGPTLLAQSDPTAESGSSQLESSELAASVAEKRPVTRAESIFCAQAQDSGDFARDCHTQLSVSRDLAVQNTKTISPFPENIPSDSEADNSRVLSYCSAQP